ncbi:hypothetical protein [Cytobacillus massiliigabonensis]|uniref:hypothetical protein n=1 Tax=Cytobacillus massiliigabonensis TaxID=1871011 RepID=UPI000C845BC6|nr:hypothetical protein [Cytobacillus massiliigabonensis]
MPQQRLYYEYVNQKLIPYWYVLTFSPSELNWDKHVFYYDAIKPFEFIGRDEYDESLNVIAIKLSDLVFNIDLPGKIGIHLNEIRKRIEKKGIDPAVINQLIIPTPELDNFVKILPEHRKINFIIQD